MIPTTREIAMQIALMHELYPDETITQLANRLMYSPLFIINALDEGERMELFSRVKEDDKLVATTPVDYTSMMGMEFGVDNTRIQNEIVRAIAAANIDKQDIESKTLQFWMRGIKPSEIEIAIHVLKKIGFIAEYTLADPKDLKSTYTFYTLSINEGKDWGKKQFKNFKPNDDNKKEK